MKLKKKRGEKWKKMKGQNKRRTRKKNCQLSSQFHYLFIETVKLTPVGLNFLLIFIWF
jgi:hypothetical protein